MNVAISSMPNGGHSVEPLARLSALLSTRAHEFLQPSLDLQTIAIEAAKATLSPLAAAIADTQDARRNENRRKRKRRNEAEEEEPVLQLKQIYTEGFGVKQIWEQAKRVIDAASFELEREVDAYQNRIAQEAQSEESANGKSRKVHFDRSDSEDATEDDLDFDQEDLEEDIIDEHPIYPEDLTDMEDEDATAATDEDIEADLDDEMASENVQSDHETYVSDPNGLNDGFFSIDDFNKQSQFLEQMDARGDDDNPSDEDEIDWDADPLAAPIFTSTKITLGSKKAKDLKRHNRDEDEDDGDGTSADEEGPTFGNVDLETSENVDDDMLDSNDEEGLDGEFGLSNANDIKYAEFFEPPPKKLSKTKRMRALPKTQPEPQTSARRDDGKVQDDIERAIADVRRDLLDSDEEEEMDGEDFSDDNLESRGNQANKNMSTHEKQRAVIAAEIRRLEAANVAKRDWQLSGEARAAERPVNSLIEEDLEFERAGKPIPVTTAETTEEIEQLIKRRILAREFDEVIRRSAIGVGSASDTRRGRIELDDNKPQTSLGEIYEQEHLKQANPDTYVDTRSAAVKKQHEQIDVLWREVNEQLNLLSNLHFKPRRLDIELKTVQDKPRIAMEDARPVGGEFESGEGGMLAPQEVYKPGGTERRSNDTTDHTNKVITSKSGTSQNKEEMTREEKLRRRRREKERAKKAQGNKMQVVLGTGNETVGVGGGSGDGNKKQRKIKEQEKADIISDLKRGNVRLVGKDGQLQNIAKTKNKNAGAGDHSKLVDNVGNLKL